MPTGDPKRKHPGSWPASSCDCSDCRQACLNSPGWFLPGQLAALAAALGRSREEIFRTSLALGTTLMPDGKSQLGVMPHKLRDFKKPGQIWKLTELAEPGRCIFYERGKCAIYSVRPYECSRMQHTDTDLQTHELRYFIVNQWDRNELAPYLAWSRENSRGRSGRRRGRGRSQ
jgi:Fe-S-cluster containining protein